MQIEGRVALDFSGYRRLVWVSGRSQILRVMAVVLAAGLATWLFMGTWGAVALIALLIVPLSVELSLRRVWRRLAAGGPAVELRYEVTDAGVRVTLSGVSTHYPWNSLRPLQETAGYWQFHQLLARRVLAVPKNAFSLEARAVLNPLFAGSTGGATISR